MEYFKSSHTHRKWNYTSLKAGNDLAASKHTSTYNALHLQKIKFDSTLSLSCERWGRIITPPWLNTRSTGALDAGTAITLTATLNKEGRVRLFMAQN